MRSSNLGPTASIRQFASRFASLSPERRRGRWRIPPAVIAAGLALAALLLPERALANACTWTGTTSTAWTTAGNWTTCGGVTPGAGDTATIPNTANDPVLNSGSVTVSGLTISNGVLTVDSPATLSVGTFNLTGGTLQGTGNVTTTTLLHVTSGTMAGSGTFTLAGTATGSFDTSPLTLTRPFMNNGDITQSSNGYVSLNTGGSFTNGNSGSFDMQGGTYAFFGNVNTVTVVNTGTITRTTNSGTATIYNLVFTNTSPGTVSVTSGTLDLQSAGSSTSTGAFSISGGAILNFGGAATRTISGAVTGAGTANFTAGTTSMTGTYTVTNTTISGATANFNQVSTVTMPNLLMTSGTLAGAANVNITTLLDMNSGTMTGGGTTTLANGATGNLDSNPLTLTRPFVNNGAITQSNSGYVSLNTGGSFVNGSTGTFDMQGGTYAFFGNVNTVTLVNNGSLTRTTGSGIATIYNLVFTNTSPGTVTVTSGTLSLSTAGSSTSTGAFTISGGATLDFAGTATRNISGAVTGAGSVDFSAGTTTLTGTYTISNTTVSGGNVNFNQVATQNLPTLTMTSGTLAGTANINITTLLDFNSGTMAGGGTTTLGSAATGTFDSNPMTLTRPFVNNGSITQSNSGYFSLNTGGSFVNSSTGTVDMQGGSYAFFGNVNTVTVVNSGTLMRTTSSATATIYNLVFTNTSPGTVSVQSGTLDFETTGTSTNTGSFSVSNGATLVFGGFSTTRNISGAINGAGLVNFTGGTTTLTGTYAISNTTVSGGTVNFNQVSGQSLPTLTVSGGTVSGTANVTITTLLHMTTGTLAGGGTMTLSNLATGTLDSSSIGLTRPFVNNGAITMQGSGYFNMNTGGSFNNTATGTVEIQQDTYGFFGSVASAPLTNAGSITRTTGSGTAYIYNLAFTNTGILECQSGTLQVSNYTQTAGQTIMSGGSFGTNGTTWSLNGGILKGTGTITGNLTNAGTVSPGSSPGTITINGNYAQTAAGTLAIEQNGVNPGTDFDQLVVSGTVSLAGTIAITTGFTPVVTTSFKVIDKTSAGAITGTFTGAPEGTVLVTAGGNYRVSYIGDTGNDVVISFLTKTAFNTITPCRVADTRGAAGPALSAGATRSFPIAGACGIPLTAQAAAFNFTVVAPSNAGDLRIFPGGASLPVVSTLNYKGGQTRANNAIVLLGPSGDINVKVDQAAGQVNLIIDVNGYFE